MVKNDQKMSQKLALNPKRDVPCGIGQMCSGRMGGKSIFDGDDKGIRLSAKIVRHRCSDTREDPSRGTRQEVG